MFKRNAPTILIVDDSATTRAMIKRVIEMTSLNVGELLEAADGKAALDLMGTTPVNLVLADLNMPVMDGFAMIQAMRSRGELRLIPVIVISAQPDPDEIDRLKRSGVVGYLPKPFTPEGMSSIVGPLLESAKQVAVAAQATAASFNLNLAEALVEGMETMAFISPELPEKPQRALARPDTRLVHVAFYGGGYEGTFTLAAPRKFGETVADNCGANDPVHEADDALKELSNVICGLLLRKRLGGGVGFRMAPPTMGRPDEMEHWNHLENVVTVNADGFLVTAHVTAEHGVLETVESA